MQVTLDISDERSVIQWAEKLAPCLITPAVLVFSGDIGVGKTTFIRALLLTMGVTGAVKSPTFSIVESYRLDHNFFHHFDLYRINDETELEFIGFRDYFDAQSICCIEWPERALQWLRHIDMYVTMSMTKDGRLMHISSKSSIGKQMLSCLIGK